MADILALTHHRRRPIPVLLLSGARTLEKSLIINHLLSDTPSLRIRRIDLNKWFFPEDPHPYHTAAEGALRDIRRDFRQNASDCIILEAEPDFRVRDFLKLFLLDVSSSMARIHGILSMVDGSTLLETAVRTKMPRQTPYTIIPETHQFLNQLECCDLVLVRCWNDFSANQKQFAKYFLRLLQPRAQLVPKINRRMSASLLHQRWFESEFTTRSSSWQQLLSICGRLSPDEDRSPIPNSLVYRRSTPFHYGKLLHVLKQFPKGIIRSSGTVWLNTKVQCELILDQLRGHYVSLTLPTEPIDESAQPQTELVFIGGGNEYQHLISRLDNCLIQPLRILPPPPKRPHLTLVPPLA